MASNNYQWSTNCSLPRKAYRVHNVDVFTTLSTQVAILTKQIGSLTTNVSHTPLESCDLCDGPHVTLNAKLVIHLLHHSQNKHSLWEISISSRTTHSPTHTMRDGTIILFFRGETIKMS